MKRKFSFGTTAEPQQKTKRLPYGSAGLSVLNYIRDNPGATAKDISKALNSQNHAVDNWLWKLSTEKKIVHSDSRPYQYSIGEKVTTVRKGTRKPRNGTPHGETISRVLDYASKNDGKGYTISHMSRELNLAYPAVFATVKRLKQRGLLAKDFNLGNEQLVEAPTPAAPTITKIDTIEFLIWEYVKETRSTDIFGFLTWIENR